MKYHITTIFLILFFSKSVIGGICTSGTSSLINIPVARVTTDEKVVLGMGYVNHRVAYLSNGIYDNFPLFITIGYLPRIEFSAGVVFVPGRRSYDGTNTYKDGVVSLQLIIFKEKKWIPAVAIGARDIYSYILLNTSFIVLSKNIVSKKHSGIYLHWGYGLDVIDQHLGVLPVDRKLPVGHTIIGMFAGLEMKWKNQITYMMEFDSKKINTGFRFRVNPYLEFEVDLFNMSEVCGGVNVSFKL